VVVYKDCSSYVTRRKRGPARGVGGLSIKNKIFKTHLVRNQKPTALKIKIILEHFKNCLGKMYKAFSLDMWYNASSSWPFTKRIHSMPL